MFILANTYLIVWFGIMVALFFVFGTASLFGSWAVTALSWAIFIWFVGCILYVLVGAVMAPFREAKERKKWEQKMEAQRRQILGRAP